MKEKTSVYWKNKEPEVELDENGEVAFEEGRQYKGSELEAMADALLKNFAKRELCRICIDNDREVEGQETGKIVPVPQFNKNGDPIIEDGRQRVVDFPEIACDLGHKWFKGEGKARTNAGRDPVLFKDHLDQRRRREIYTTEGTPDPNIVSGIYNRSHPQGRKINTDKQRREHGASYYR